MQETQHGGDRPSYICGRVLPPLVPMRTIFWSRVRPSHGPPWPMNETKEASGSLATVDRAGRVLKSSTSSRPRERKRSSSRFGWNDVSGLLLLGRRVSCYCMQLSGVSTSAGSPHGSRNTIGRPPNLLSDILARRRARGGAKPTRRNVQPATFAHASWTWQIGSSAIFSLSDPSLLPSSSPSHLR